MTGDTFTWRLDVEEYGGGDDPRLLVLGNGHDGPSVIGSLATDRTVPIVDEFGVDAIVARVTDSERTDVIGDQLDPVVAALSILVTELATGFERVTVSTARW